MKLETSIDMPVITLNCNYCLKDFRIRKSLRTNKKHYCSKKCATLGRIRDIYNSK